MPVRTLRDWNPGDPLKADHWQEPVDALRDLESATAARDGRVQPPPRRFVVLTLTNQGPNGEADWNNNAYWAKISYIAGGTQGNNLTINPDLSEYPPDNSGDTPAPVIVVAYNQAEEANYSHLLATDGNVHVVAWVIEDYGDPSRTRYVFDHSPNPVVISGLGYSTSDPNGHYTGSTILYGPGPASASVVVDNATEASLSSPTGQKIHLLPSDWEGPGVTYGQTTDTPPKLKVRISGQIPLNVTLTTDGGANATTPAGTATYTYTVKGVHGDILMTAQSPLWARPQGILVGPATNGVIGWNGSGVLQLLTTDEQPQLEDCTTSGGGG